MDDFSKNYQKIWQFPLKSFDQDRVNRQLMNFHPDHLINPHSRRQLKQFAQDFSSMDIKEQDLANMSYENFMALKQIMSLSLNEITQTTEQQSIKLEEVQKQNKVLERQLEKLNRIEKQNKQKEQEIQQAIEKLKNKYQTTN